MKSMDLLDAIGSIRDTYILEASKIREQAAPAKKTKTAHTVRFRIAAMLALVLAGILFLQTPMGVAAVETVKESVSKLIEALFPPKDIIVVPEGIPEAVHHEAQGRAPEMDEPGFIMYVDTENYVMTEENGVYYVRQIPFEYDREEIRNQQAALLEGLSPEAQEAAIDERIQELEDFYAALPANEIEIREVSDREFSAYAEEIRNQMSANWEIAKDIIWIDKPTAFTFTASGGSAWDSPCEVHYFVNNGEQGTFHIIARYRLEAAEGHGARFTSMIQTFTIVTNEDAAPYTADNTNILENMRQEVSSAIELDDAILFAAQQDTNTYADLDAYAMERYEVWINTLTKLWPALEQSLDAETMQDLLASQLEWSAHKLGEQNIAVAETQSQREYWNSGADSIEQRVYYLLNILEGAAPVQPRDSSIQLSPEVVISQFIKAYYSGDKETVKQYLSDSYRGSIEVYTDLESADPVIHSIKGLDNLILDMGYWGRLYPSVEFKITSDSDYFVYLSMTLTWENSEWKVSEYGLEG